MAQKNGRVGKGKYSIVWRDSVESYIEDGKNGSLRSCKAPLERVRKREGNAWAARRDDCQPTPYTQAIFTPKCPDKKGNDERKRERKKKINTPGRELKE